MSLHNRFSAPLLLQLWLNVAVAVKLIMFKAILGCTLVLILKQPITANVTLNHISRVWCDSRPWGGHEPPAPRRAASGGPDAKPLEEGKPSQPPERAAASASGTAEPSPSPAACRGVSQGTGGQEKAIARGAPNTRVPDLTPQQLTSSSAGAGRARAPVRGHGWPECPTAAREPTPAD